MKSIFSAVLLLLSFGAVAKERPVDMPHEGDVYTLYPDPLCRTTRYTVEVVVLGRDNMAVVYFHDNHTPDYPESRTLEAFLRVFEPAPWCHGTPPGKQP